MVVDLSGIPEEVQRELLPAGVYAGQVNDVQVGLSRKGNPMMTWIFGVQNAAGEDRTLFYHTILNDERGLSRIKRAVTRLLNSDETFDWAQFKPAETAEWAVGRACRVVVRIQNSPEYGKSNSVSDILPAESGFLQ